MKTRVISFSNQKGGVGKTTSAVNVAYILSQKHGKKVLLVDLDQQANATDSLGYYEQVEEKDWRSFVNVLGNQLEMKEIVFTIRNNLDILPSNIDMAVINSEINTMPGRDMFFNKKLSEIKDNYDFVIIDLPPALNVFVTSVFFASDEVYIPITPSPYAMRGLNELLRFINNIDQFLGEYKENKIYKAGFITRFKENEIASKKTLEKMKESELELLNTKIRNSTQVDKGLYDKKIVAEFDPQNNTTKDYEKLVEELLGVKFNV